MNDYCALSTILSAGEAAGKRIKYVPALSELVLEGTEKTRNLLIFKLVLNIQ